MFQPARPSVRWSSVANCLGGLVAHVALSEDFHSDDSLSVGPHFLDDADNCVGVGVHMRADGIEAYQINVDPWRSGCGSQGLNAVARDAVRADDALCQPPQQVDGKGRLGDEAGYTKNMQICRYEVVQAGG